ncbi:MAG: FHA domain-containing protein [Sedimentisphaerales bacterium]|nr:FHA domain-containing protein [Sedimentisphaerales bacterium]
MRLVVKRNGQIVNEFQFDRGPVYIGRHAHSQVFLHDRAVSRRHAAIFTTEKSVWVVEDMDSANKTYLNDKAIHKANIKTGDSIRIADFVIEVNLESEKHQEKSIHLADTLMPSTRKTTAALTDPSREIIIRKADAERGADITVPVERIKDFMQATEEICKANGLDSLVKVLLDISLKHFKGYHSFCALRIQPAGPMTCHAGKCRDGHGVNINDLKLKEKINQSVETRQFTLIPKASAPTEENRIRSALIAPIIDPTGCFGVLYVDNSMDHEQYTLSDLDYLMLIAIHTAAIIGNF